MIDGKGILLHQSYFFTYEVSIFYIIPSLKCTFSEWWPVLQTAYHWKALLLAYDVTRAGVTYANMLCLSAHISSIYFCKNENVKVAQLEEGECFTYKHSYRALLHMLN